MIILLTTNIVVSNCIISINYMNNPYAVFTIIITITSHSASPTIMCKVKYPRSLFKCRFQIYRPWAGPVSLYFLLVPR